MQFDVKCTEIQISTLTADCSAADCSCHPKSNCCVTLIDCGGVINFWKKPPEESIDNGFSLEMKLATLNLTFKLNVHIDLCFFATYSVFILSCYAICMINIPKLVQWWNILKRIFKNLYLFGGHFWLVSIGNKE